MWGISGEQDKLLLLLLLLLLMMMMLIIERLTSGPARGERVEWTPLLVQDIEQESPLPPQAHAPTLSLSLSYSLSYSLTYSLSLSLLLSLPL